jgi:hypothetical protein
MKRYSQAVVLGPVFGWREVNHWDTKTPCSQPIAEFLHFLRVWKTKVKLEHVFLRGKCSLMVLRQVECPVS